MAPECCPTAGNASTRLPGTPVFDEHTAAVQVTAGVCTTLVLAAMAPCLVCLWKFPHPRALLRATAYAALCAFMFGFHVHEKASLTVVVLLAAEALANARNKRCAPLVFKRRLSRCADTAATYGPLPVCTHSLVPS